MPGILSADDVQCIRGSFSVLDDPTGSKFFSILGTTDPNLQAKMSQAEQLESEEGVDEKELPPSYLTLIANAVDELEDEGAPPSAGLMAAVAANHAQYKFVEDDYFVLEEALLMLVQDAAVHQSKVYDVAVKSAWETVLQASWLAVTGADAAARAAAASNVTSLHLDLVRTSFAKVKPVLLGKYPEEVAAGMDYTELAEAMMRLDGTAPGSHLLRYLTCVVSLWGSDGFDECMMEFGKEHATVRLDQYHAQLQSCILHMVLQQSSKDVLIIVAETKRAWRKLLRHLHSSLWLSAHPDQGPAQTAFHLGGGDRQQHSQQQQQLPSQQQQLPSQQQQLPSQQLNGHTAAYESPARRSEVDSIISPLPMGKVMGDEGTVRPSTARSMTSVVTTAQGDHCISVRDVTLSLIDDGDIHHLFLSHCEDDCINITREKVRQLYLDRCALQLDVDHRRVDALLNRYSSNGKLSYDEFAIIILEASRL